jgi:predicted RNA-binding protein with RPS1 domain
VGDIVSGKVTKLVPFGAFVSVADGIEGLVHISEMSQEHVETPEQVVVVGEEVQVKIIDVDLARRRISLSIKQAGGTTSGGFDPSVYKESPFEEREERRAPGRERAAYAGQSGFRIGDEHSEALGDLKAQLEQQEAGEDAEGPADSPADSLADPEGEEAPSDDTEE